MKTLQDIKTYTISEINIDYDTYTACPLVAVNGLYPDLKAVYMEDGTSIWYDPEELTKPTTEFGIWFDKVMKNPYKNPVNFVVFLVVIILLTVACWLLAYLGCFILAGIVMFGAAIYGLAGTFLSGLFNKK